MTFGVYAIRDVKTGFMSPHVEESDPVAIRNFEHAVQSSDGILMSHAADFSFYRLGSFDSATGLITADTMPTLIMEAIDCVS